MLIILARFDLIIYENLLQRSLSIFIKIAKKGPFLRIKEKKITEHIAMKTNERKKNVRINMVIFTG